ncbi:hypothetical protein BH23VER1_BH23VER1_31630 [soil metagenome]
MPALSGKDLVDAGWPEGPVIGELLARARFLEEEKGIVDRKYLLKLLRRHIPVPLPKLAMRPPAEAAPLAEAIVAVGAEEERNVGAVRRQMGELLRAPLVRAGAVMPDACPVGGGTAVIPVGGVIAVENAIVPAAHSADICCSMFATFYRCDRPTGEQLDALAGSTRFGPGGRDESDLVHHPVLDEPVWENRFLNGLDHKARIHMADQGDGNHFAFLGEVGAAGDAIPGLAHGRYRVLVTHHGSRGLGSALYKRGQAAAVKATAKAATGIPPAAAWLDARDPEGAEYWEALQYVSRWTRANHESIHARFLERLGGIAPDATLGNEHNFVWRRGDLFLHGKGATPAWDGQLGLIPLNMAEPILLVAGSDNADFLSFAPHGAGRNISRTALMRQFRDRKSHQLDAAAVAASIAASTAGLDVRWFCGSPDLSETPIAYKDAAAVRAQIARFGLAEVIAEIRPLGCIMAGGSGRLKPWEEGYEKPLTPKQVRQIQHRAGRRKERQKDWGADPEEN